MGVLRQPLIDDPYSGLQHSFVDSTVENGQTYFYAVVSYDRGAPDIGTGGLPPSESASVIDIDAFGNVVGTDINTVVVTPNPKVPGYVPPFVEEESLRPVGNLIGTGRIAGIRVIDERLVADRSYQVTFQSSDQLIPFDVSTETPAQIFLTTSYSVTEVT